MASLESLMSRFSVAHIDILLAKAASSQEVDAIVEIGVRYARARLEAALREFESGSILLLDLTRELQDAIRRIGHAPGLEEMLVTANELSAILNDAERVPSTADEEDIGDNDPVVVDPMEPGPQSEVTEGSITSVPTSSKATTYSKLEQEYVDFFKGAAIRAEHRGSVIAMANQAVANKQRYVAVGDQLGIPWWFIAGIHQMEATFNFGKHLHNGDPLARRTVRVPANRPTNGSGPFTWEESALDALQFHKFHQETNWSLPRALFLWEKYNGFGYRPRQLPTPYLWSFSTLYEKGKFVADRVFDGNAVSRQCGVGTLVKQLHKSGHVELFSDEMEDRTEPDIRPSPEGDSTVPTQPDLDTSTLVGFHRFFADNLPDVLHFRSTELMLKGASHAINGLNTDPPQHLWSNVINLARLLEAIRVELGAPVKLLSIYRSERYNQAVGGATGSFHRTFQAADFTVLNTPTTLSDWANVADRIQRSTPKFHGGLGVYTRNNFIHVDVRGHLQRGFGN